MDDKTFYGNCLIELIKAKLKDWKNIKPHWRLELHFWYEKDGKSFHFAPADRITVRNYLWHKGRILRRFIKEDQ